MSICLSVCLCMSIWLIVYLLVCMSSLLPHPRSRSLPSSLCFSRSLSLAVSVSVSLFLCICRCHCLCLSVSHYRSFFLYNLSFIFISLYIFLSVRLSVCQCFSLYVCVNSELNDHKAREAQLIANPPSIPSSARRLSLQMIMDRRSHSSLLFHHVIFWALYDWHGAGNVSMEAFHKRLYIAGGPGHDSWHVWLYEQNAGRYYERGCPASVGGIGNT